MITAQQAVQRKLPLPHRLLLLSPLLDATKNNPVKNVLAPRDPVLEPEGCQEAALLYAGSEPLDSPLVSPDFRFHERAAEGLCLDRDQRHALC